jgi:hypothetical protein
MDMQDKVGNAQTEKFNQAARALEWNEDDARRDATLKMVAKHRPLSEKPE